MAQGPTREESLRLEIKVLRDRLRRATNEAVQSGAILHWIEEVLDGHPLCDFAESFGVVRRVADLVSRIATAKEER